MFSELESKYIESLAGKINALTYQLNELASRVITAQPLNQCEGCSGNGIVEDYGGPYTCSCIDFPGGRKWSEISPSNPIRGSKKEYIPEELPAQAHAMYSWQHVFDSKFVYEDIESCLKRAKQSGYNLFNWNDRLYQITSIIYTTYEDLGLTKDLVK